VIGLQQRNEGIQCALICVAEMLKVAWFIPDGEIYDYLLKVKGSYEYPLILNLVTVDDIVSTLLAIPLFINLSIS
jgi:hypothetical protein